MSTVEERVQAGVAWLDKNAPENWRSRVSEYRLSMSQPCDCICGQVFESLVRSEQDTGYAVALRKSLVGEFALEGWALAHGFLPDFAALRVASLLSPPADQDMAYWAAERDAWVALEEAWLAALQAPRLAPKPERALVPA